MITHRDLDVATDRGTLLEFHATTNYESGTPWLRLIPFEQFRRWWLGSSQVAAYLADLTESLKDRRTIAEIWEDDGSVVAYVWARFTDIPVYGLTVAQVEDVAVVPEYRRRGIATLLMAHVEQLAVERGANLLRSGTGIENVASQELHRSLGFHTIRLDYEKILGDIPWDGLPRLRRPGDNADKKEPDGNRPAA